MKKGNEHSESSRKKLVGEYLRNADKLLKSGEYEEALSEVEKSLELEPGNFYAQAYKERINALREKHGRTGELRPSPPAGGLGARTGLVSPPQRPATPPAPESGAGEDADQATGAGVEGALPKESPLQGETDIAGLRDQLERERATQESETHRQAEEIAMKALEEELRQREDADRLKTAEQQALADALAAAPSEARREIVERAKADFGELISKGDTDGAFTQLARIRIVDPVNADLADLELRLDSATSSVMKVPAGEVKPLPREIAMQWFGKLLRSAWSEGQPNRVQAEAITRARTRFSVTDDEEKPLLAGIQREIVVEAVRQAYTGGEPDPETRSFIETLARELSVGDLESLLPKATK